MPIITGLFFKRWDIFLHLKLALLTQLPDQRTPRLNIVQVYSTAILYMYVIVLLYVDAEIAWLFSYQFILVLSAPTYGHIVFHK